MKFEKEGQSLVWELQIEFLKYNFKRRKFYTDGNEIFNPYNFPLSLNLILEQGNAL